MIFGESDSQAGPPHGQPQRSIRLDTSGLDTVYANFFAVAGSPDDVALYFGASSMLPGASEPMVRLSQRVMMIPSAAKRLMLALQQTIKQHEERFGPIELPPMQPPKTTG